MRATCATQSLVIDAGAARLAGDHDLVGGRQRLAGHAQLPGIDAGLGALAEEQVDHLVGDAIANLVRMPLRNGFAREQVGLARHGAPHVLDCRAKRADCCSVCPGVKDDRPTRRAHLGVPALRRDWACRPESAAAPCLSPVSSLARLRTRSTMARRALASEMRTNALLSSRPSRLRRNSTMEFSAGLLGKAVGYERLRLRRRELPRRRTAPARPAPAQDRTAGWRRCG